MLDSALSVVLLLAASGLHERPPGGCALPVSWLPAWSSALSCLQFQFGGCTENWRVLAAWWLGLGALVAARARVTLLLPTLPTLSVLLQVGFVLLSLLPGCLAQPAALGRWHRFEELAAGARLPE